MRSSAAATRNHVGVTNEIEIGPPIGGLFFERGASENRSQMEVCQVGIGN